MIVAAMRSSACVIGGGFAMTQLSQPEVGDDLATTLHEAQQGNQDAWEALFKECYPKVRRVVRRRLDRSMRSLYDSTDFASDAMERLAANLGQLQFPSVNSLIAFLAEVAEKKVIDEHRRRHTLKRDAGREQRFWGRGADDDDGPVQLPSDEPTASQLTQADEVLERLLARGDETERLIIKLRREGHTTSDISIQTGWNIRKVQRFLKELLDSLDESGDRA
jgi:RNA polymerase sigma factor (sigma-70 family)